MNSKVVALCLSASMMPALQARGADLPAGCGPDSVRFDVTTQKGQPTPSAPEAGKAQIVFIETMEKEGMTFCIGCDVVTRVGANGAWIGANKGNSFFSYTVDPGEYHVCVDWQSLIGKLRRKVGMDDFIADPDKIYYYQIRVRNIEMSEDYTELDLQLIPLSQDEGTYLLKHSVLSTSKAKK